MANGKKNSKGRPTYRDMSSEQKKRYRKSVIARNRKPCESLPGSRIEDNPDYDAIMEAIKKEKKR